ncbi:MAG: hypothetical protein II670_00230, partial [Alphaproteobacteria bacterium]|nr:hypothetical protein [Alphaproteobacteria bacterium]
VKNKKIFLVFLILINWGLNPSIAQNIIIARNKADSLFCQQYVQNKFEDIGLKIWPDQEITGKSKNLENIIQSAQQEISQKNGNLRLLNNLYIWVIVDTCGIVRGGFCPKGMTDSETIVAQQAISFFQKEEFIPASIRKKKLVNDFLFLITPSAIAQDFVNPIPKREIRKLERWMMRRYRRNKDCDCTISRDSITMIHVFWVGYDTEGFIDKDCFISLDFAKHIKPWHDQYGCQRYLSTCTGFFDNRGVFLGSAYLYWFDCHLPRADYVNYYEKLYDEITKHGIKHVFQIYNLALGELIGVSENGEVYLISGTFGDHFKTVKIQNIPDDYWFELFEKPENPGKRKSLDEIEILDESNYY